MLLLILLALLFIALFGGLAFTVSKFFLILLAVVLVVALLGGLRGGWGRSHSHS